MDRDEVNDDFLKDDVKEHAFLDDILADIGVKPMKAMDAVDLEIATHTDIEEFVKNDDAKTEVDINDDAMRTYLTNTNLPIKRKVSGITFTIVGAERGVAGLKCNNCVGTKDIKNNLFCKRYI